MPANSPQNIPITETWQRDDWSNFDVTQATSSNLSMGRQGDGGTNNFGVGTQQHVDISDFLETGWSGTGVSHGYTAALNHGPALAMTCSIGANAATNTTLGSTDLPTLTNYAPNPSFEHDTEGHAPNGWVTYGTNVLDVLNATDAGASAFSGSLMLEAAYGNDVRLASLMTTRSVQTFETRTISAYVWIPAGWNGGQITIDNDYVSTFGPTINQNANMSLRNQWQRIWLAYEAGGIGSGGVFIRTASPPTSGPMYILIDGVMDNEGEILQPYGDGDTPDWYWDGTPGNSASSTIGGIVGNPIDITSVGSGYVILALPNFPLANVNVSQCFLDLGTNGFGSESVALSFATSLNAVASGNTFVKFPLSALGSLDPTNITSARIRITATGSCTVYAMALRFVGTQWIPSNLDFDSVSGVLRRSIPLNGSSSAIVPSNQVLPILWRSGSLSGIDDPMPINSEISFVFNTGSQSSTNSFTLFMRGNNDDLVTQLDLEGQTQSQLTGRPQPFETQTDFLPRTVGDLDGLSLGSLSGQTLLELERTNNTSLPSSWIGFYLQWGTSSVMQIYTTDNTNGYQYVSGWSLANNTLYTCVCNVTESSARMQIYTMNQSTWALGNILFDSGLIPDAFMFNRRPGRIGFQANLSDGDTYVGAIQPRGLMFAEYRSKPLTSITPVRGARLYVQGSPDTELFSGWQALSDANTVQPTIRSDHQRFVVSDNNQTSTAVTVVSPSTVSPSQGIISNALTPIGDPISGITNFDQLDLSFSVWIPSTAFQGVGQGVITAALQSSHGALLPITLPQLGADQWTTVQLFRPLVAPYPQSDIYRLILYYNGLVSTTWWVDAVSVHEHSIKFEGRSVVDDPWMSNQAPWTPFHDTINSDVDGVVFTNQGAQLQMRAQALRQDAAILSSPKLVPQYARLGRFVWPEQAPTLGTPTATFITSNTGRTFNFNGQSSTSPNGNIGNYYWYFGDGTYGVGPFISHTYSSWVASGTAYTVIMSIIDNAGVASSASPNIITLP